MAEAAGRNVPVEGRVYGTLLNYRGAFEALAGAMHEKPYLRPPTAVVLYLKTANTLIGDGRPVPLPADVPEVEIGAALGVVIGRTATRVKEDAALGFVRGYVVLNDATVPHASVYRPPVRYRCRDGFCPIGARIVPKSAIPDPDRLALSVSINGEVLMENGTANLIRPVARLIAEVTDFTTLFPGDVLHVGVPENSPRARIGDRVRVEIEGVGSVENPIVAEDEAVGAAA